MLSLKTTVLLGLATLAWSSPIENALMARADDCDPTRMAPDKKYSNCPSTQNIKKNGIDNGNCLEKMPGKPGDEGCMAYCEQTIALKYGKEVPIEGATCNPGSLCTITKGQSVTTTQTWEISGKVGFPGKRDMEEIEKKYNIVDLVIREDKAPTSLKGTFDLGASYSWSRSVTYTDTVGTTKTNNDTNGNCAYYTFVPYLVESCGILTEVEEVHKPKGSIGHEQLSYVETSCNKKNVLNSKEWCNTIPMKNDDDKPQGMLVFVWIDCTSKEYKSSDNPAVYNYPDVQLKLNPDSTK